jgi:plasmid stability protein
MSRLVTAELDDALAERLGERAARNGRSPSEEARSILAAALAAPGGAGAASFGDAVRGLLGDEGGWDLDLPVRDAVRSPPGFSG